MPEPIEPEAPAAAPTTSARELADDLTFALRDRDDDQVLTPLEFERPRGVTARLKDPDEFARYDQNQDGVVDRAEWKEGRAQDRQAD